jgi:aldehyde dehydrogenase (NAD+)
MLSRRAVPLASSRLAGTSVPHGLAGARGLASAVTLPKIKNTRLFIDNEWVPASSGSTFQTFNPTNEELLADIHEAGEEDVERAVASARHAFDKGPWSKATCYDRSNLLRRLADLVEKHRDELAALEALDNGKPYHVANAVDVGMTIQCLRYYSGWADKISGKTIPVASNDYFTYTRKEPIGVAAQIIPWNFPLLMAAWKLGPVLATGCVSILKPAEQTPLSALRLADLIKEAGYPAGVVNVLPGQGNTGALLAKHPLVDKVAFTGSTEVGHKIMAASAASNLKRVTLELGGKSPNIVLPDADLSEAVAGAHFGLFFNHGQVCTAGSRVFVHKKQYDEFVDKSTQLAKNRKVGNPLHGDTEQGPQISQEQLDRILHFTNLGKKEGASLRTGGARVGNKGYFMEPTVFADVSDDMTIAREEIFGPVMSIMKYSDLDEVIERANDSIYGLAAGLWTRDLGKAHYVASKLKAGTVWINCFNVYDSAQPFGGFKRSGMGRELGEEALSNYLEHKSVVTKLF